MKNLLAKFRKQDVGVETAKKYETSIKIIDSDLIFLNLTIREMEQKYGHLDVPYKIFGTFVFMRLSFKDILTLEKYIKTIKNPSERNLFARTLALLLYELLDDMGQLFGKTYGTYLVGQKFNDELRVPLKLLRKVYNTVKKEIMSKLTPIRHSTIAHKDHDAIRQLQFIESIDVSEIEMASAAVQLVYLQYMAFEKELRKAIMNEVEAKSQSG